MTEAERIGARIRLARLDSNLTQSVVAQRLGVRQANISSWESGIYSPSWEHLAGLGKILGRDPSWFVTEKSALEHMVQADEIVKLARQLQEHPALLKAVKAALVVDAKTKKVALNLSESFKIPYEAALIWAASKK